VGFSINLATMASFALLRHCTAITGYTTPSSPKLSPQASWRAYGAITDLLHHECPAAYTSALGAFLAGLLCTARRTKPRRTQQGSARATKMARQAARLHGHPGTRSPLVNWYCLEAEIPIEMRDPRPSPHPFGQVPHLSDDDGVEVFESGAILLYLADKYGGNNSPEQRAKYTKWVVWANASLEEICFGPGMSGTRITQPSTTLDVLEQMLASSEWLVDGAFSVADVAVASYLNYIPLFFGTLDLGSRPNIAAYMKRCAERPAFKEAFGQGHADAVKANVLG